MDFQPKRQFNLLLFTSADFKQISFVDYVEPIDGSYDMESEIAESKWFIYWEIIALVTHCRLEQLKSKLKLEGNSLM